MGMQMRVYGTAIAVALASLASATTTGAQSARTRSDSVYLRAQTLVSEGSGAEGRALVDSMLETTLPGSLPYAEGLFWRATLAPTAAEAERDYRRIVIDHPLSPRVEDALLRLAQLELARGDRENALRHLQRLAAEFPASASRPRTGYWIARVLFESNDVPGACAANTDALQRVDPRDIELKNQIEYQQQRCRGNSTVAATGTRLAPPAGARDTSPWIPPPATISAPAPARTAPNAPRPAGTTTAGSTGPFSVQVAALSTRAAAQAIVVRLNTRGYEARIDGTAAPFRVRVGRYPTRAAAARALTAMKARGQDGFVVQTDTR